MTSQTIRAEHFDTGLVTVGVDEWSRSISVTVANFDLDTIQLSSREARQLIRALTDAVFEVDP